MSPFVGTAFRSGFPGSLPVPSGGEALRGQPVLSLNNRKHPA